MSEVRSSQQIPRQNEGINHQSTVADYDRSSVQRQSNQNLKTANQSQSEHSHTQNIPAVELIKPIEESSNTTEFLMLTLQRALNYEPAQVQELLTNRNQFLFQACERGILGDFQPIIVWLRLIIHHMNNIIQLFRVAYARQSTVEVNLVLGSVRLGLYSENMTVCSLALEFIERVADLLFEITFEYGLQVKKLKNKKQQIQEIKVPIFRQFQDWAIQSKKPNPGQKTHKQPVIYQQQGDPNSILRIICEESLQNHPSLSEQAASLFLAVFREVQDPGLPPTASISHLPDRLHEVFTDDIFLSYSSLSMILPEMRKIDRGATQHLILESNLMYSLLDHASQSQADLAVRLQCTTLLIDLWSYESQIMSSGQLSDGVTAKDKFYEVLQSGIQHPDKVYRITVLGSAFGLLDHLIQIKSTESPALLKVMITSFIQLMRDSVLKDRISEEFTFKNFLQIFNNYPEIPIFMLIEPTTQIFSERIKGNRDRNQFKFGNLTSEEINFLIQLTKHPKLPQNSAYLIMELFATLYIGKPSVAQLVLPSILELVQKFQSTPKLMSFIETILITKALSSILNFKKEEQQNQSSTPYASALAITQSGSNQSSQLRQNSIIKIRGTSQKDKQMSKDLNVKIQRYQMVNIVDKLLELKIQSIEQVVQDQLKPLTEKYLAMFKTTSSAYEYLITKYKLQIQPSQLQVALYQGPRSENGGLKESRSDGQLIYQDNSIEGLQRQIREIDQKRAQSKQKQKMLRWSETKDPKNEIALRAIEAMNEIKQQRMKRQNAERIEEVKKKEKMDKITVLATADVAMSRLILEREEAQRKQKMREILGSQSQLSEQKSKDNKETIQVSLQNPVQSKTPLKSLKSLSDNTNELNPFNPLILENPKNQIQPTKQNEISESEFKILLGFSRIPREGICLVNFEFDEEIRERDAMRLLVYKNQTLFAFLFKKYSALGQLNKRKGSIEVSIQRTISMGEVQRFLRENGVDIVQITQKELQTLVKMINDFFLLRYQSTALEFSGFVQCIIQASIIIHRRGRFKDISSKESQYLLFAQMVQNLLKQFKDHAQKRGESLQIYSAIDVIDSRSFPQPVIQSKYIQQEEGQPQNQWFDFSIPQSMESILGEKKCFILEILNQITLKNFSFSIFEGVSLHGPKVLPIKVQKQISPKQKIHSSTKSIEHVETIDHQVDHHVNNQHEDQFGTLDESNEADAKKPKKKKKSKKKIEETQEEPSHTESHQKIQEPEKETQVPHNESSQNKVNQKKPQDLDIYSVQNLIKGLQLNQKSIGARNIRKDKENEQILMGLQISPQIKLVCYELQNIHPQSELDNLREIAQVLDDILKVATDETGTQQYGKNSQVKRFVPKPPQPSLSQPKIPKLIDKLSQEQQTQFELQKKKDEQFQKRGMILKEQLNKYKELKQERDQLKQSIAQDNSKEQRKIQELQERQQKQKEILQKMKSEREDQFQTNQKRTKLKEEIQEMLKFTKQKCRTLCNQLFDMYRQRFTDYQEVLQQKNGGQKILQEEEETAYSLMELYRDNEKVLTQLTEAGDVLKKTFSSILLFQNYTSRTQGQPQHRGLNLDGLLNFCIKSKLVPDCYNFSQISLMVQHQLRCRQVLEPDILGVQTPSSTQIAQPLLQTINFTKQGGHLNYEEFCLFIIRLLGCCNEDQLLKQDSTRLNETDASIQHFKEQAVELGIDQECQQDLVSIQQSMDQLKTFASIIKQDQTEKSSEKLPVINQFKTEEIGNKLHGFFNVSLQNLKAQKDMSMPLNPYGATVATHLDQKPNLSDLKQRTNSIHNSDFQSVKTLNNESIEGTKSIISPQKRNMSAQIKGNVNQINNKNRQINVAQNTTPNLIPLKQPLSEQSEKVKAYNGNSKTLIQSQKNADHSANDAKHTSSPYQQNSPSKKTVMNGDLLESGIRDDYEDTFRQYTNE